MKLLSEALPLDSVGISVKNMSVKVVCHGSVGVDSKNDPPMGAAGFMAQVMILNHAGQISAGRATCAGLSHSHTACKFAD